MNFYIYLCLCTSNLQPLFPSNRLAPRCLLNENLLSISHLNSKITGIFSTVTDFTTGTSWLHSLSFVEARHPLDQSKSQEKMWKTFLKEGKKGRQKKIPSQLNFILPLEILEISSLTHFTTGTWIEDKKFFKHSV